MKKRLLIVEGWDIAVDEDYVNKFGISNNDSEDNSNESNFSLVDKHDSHDTTLFLRLKGLGKRQIEKVVFIAVVSYLFIFIRN